MRGKDLLQRFVRNRMARLGLAFALIAMSAWAFLPYVNYRIASSAFVNAELVRVAAPIAGQADARACRARATFHRATVRACR